MTLATPFAALSIKHLLETCRPEPAIDGTDLPLRGDDGASQRAKR
jgi:hypothetical protein